MNKWLDRYESGGLVSKNSLNRNVTCSNCGWSWKLSDGGLDPMTCHKCGGDIKMREGGELDEYKDKGQVNFKDQLYQQNRPVIDATAAPIVLPGNLFYDKTRVVNGSSAGLNKFQLKEINQNLKNNAFREKQAEIENYKAAELFHNNNPVAKLLGTRSAPASNIKPTAKELAYNAGAGINEFYDVPGIGIANDFVNPLSLVSKGIISPWMQAPLQAQQSDSYLPYAGAALSTALTYPMVRPASIAAKTILNPKNISRGLFRELPKVLSEGQSNNSFGKMELGTDTYRGMPPGSTTTYTSSGQPILPQNSTGVKSIDFSNWMSDLYKNDFVDNSIKGSSGTTHNLEVMNQAHPNYEVKKSIIISDQADAAKEFSFDISKKPNEYPIIDHLGFFNEDVNSADDQLRLFMKGLENMQVHLPTTGSTSIYSQPIMNLNLARMVRTPGRIDIANNGQKVLNNFLKKGNANQIAESPAQQIINQFPRIQKTYDVLSNNAGVKFNMNPVILHNNNEINLNNLQSLLHLDPSGINTQIIVPDYKITKHFNNGGPIVTNRGQWDYPGQTTIIPSNNITMQGVPYPVVGVDNTGHTKMMHPGMNYTFPGQYVTEYPMMENGGLVKYQTKGQVQNTNKKVTIDNRNMLEKFFNFSEDEVKNFNLPEDVYTAYETNKKANVDKRWGIASKKNVRAYFFNPDGSLAVEDEVGFGQDRGEQQPIYYQVKTTPSGTYRVERPKFAAPVVDKLKKGYASNNFFYMDNVDPNKRLVDVAGSARPATPRQAIHGIPAHLLQERSKYFNNNDVNDNYMSAGCINCRRQFLDNPYFNSFQDGLLYVLPEKQKGGEMIKRADGSYSKRGLWDTKSDWEIIG